MHDGLEVTASNPYGLVRFTCSPGDHGDPCEYADATIPPAFDPGWRPAPDGDIINFSIPSRVCYAPVDCFQYGDFTYFQTLVDIPLNVVVTTFTIAFDGMDDGSRVTIFNSAYPSGLVVPGSYVFLGGSGTANLQAYVVSGETNRVVVTQVDDCCSQNNLRSALVVLNGTPVITNPGPCDNPFPTIISLPPLAAVSGAKYEYDVRAIEPGGAPLRYFLPEHPFGMVVDSTAGIVTWVPADSQVGTHRVVVEVKDDRGDIARQPYYVVVSSPAPDTIPPAVTLQIVEGNQVLLGPEVDVAIGTTLEFRVNATDNVGVVQRALKLGAQDVPLDAQGRATMQMNAVSLSTVLATASDAAGNVGAATRRLRVYDPSDNHFPIVSIQSPLNDSLISKPADVVATAVDSILESYTVDYARLDQVDIDHLEAINPAWTNIATGSSSITAATVGRFDPTILLNDSYIIRVVAENLNGKIQTAGTIFNVFSNLKFGEFRIEFTDLAIPVAGAPIQVKRIYDSRESRDSLDFGYGWTLGVRDAHIRSVLRDYSGYRTMYPGSRVYINTPDGRRVGFTTYNIRVYAFGGFVFADIGLRSDPGVFERLEIPGAVGVVLENGYYLDGLASGPYDPDAYKLTLKDGTAYEYSKAHGLQKVTDLNGNHLDFTVDGIRHFTSGEDVPDQHVDFVRDARGRIQSIVDPNGHSLLYTYDASGDLRTFTDQVGNLTQYSYNATRPHYLDTIVDPLGHQAVRTEYDAAGRIKSVTDALGHTVSQDFNLAANTGTFTDGNGNVTISVYDDQGNIVKSTDPEGNITEFEFDANNNEIWRKDPRGFVIQRTYDASGNVTITMDPLGNQTTVAYNALNKPTSVTDALGHTTQFTYDAQGGLTGVENVLGGTLTFVHDGAGRVTSVTDFNGHTTTYDYTGGCSCGKPHVVTNADGTTRTYAYNAFGQVTQEIDELGRTTTSAYDDAGRETAVTDPTGHTKSYTYAAWLKVSETDALSRTTRYAYDAANREISITDALGGVVRFEYDAAGNRTKVTDPVGNVTQFVYDRANRLVRQIDPLGHAESFAYDGNGNRIEAIDRNGRERTFSYDGLNRRVREQWWDGASVIHAFDYTFNALGVMTGASDPASTLSFTFDALNRLTQATQSNVPGLADFTLSYGYDAQSNVTLTMDNAGVQVRSEYDARNRLSRRVWQGGGLSGASVRFTYDTAGERTGIQRYADAASTELVGGSTYGYDALGTITNIVHTNAAGTTLADYHYTRDAAQQITQRLLSGQTTDYSYDLTGQLTSAQYSSNQPNESFIYDANGNRTAGGYSVGSGNRILTDGTYSYAYDDEGSLITRTTIATGSTRSYTYDHRNRLVHVVDRDASGTPGQTLAFVYDALDRRIAKTVNGTVSRFLLDQGSTWADATAAGNVSGRYLIGAGIDEMLARQLATPAVEWYLSDNLGTVHDVVDQGSLVIAHILYDSFGRILTQSDSSTTDRFSFTGREWDPETQFFFYRSRFYDPSSGRFTTEDPRGFDPVDPNPYRYVRNRPNEGTDPSGMGLIEQAIVVGGVTGAIAAPTFDIACKISLNEIGEISVLRETLKSVSGAALGAAAGGALAYGARELIFLGIESPALTGLDPLPSVILSGSQGLGLRLFGRELFLKVPSFGIAVFVSKVFIVKNCNLLKVFDLSGL